MALIDFESVGKLSLRFLNFNLEFWKLGFSLENEIQYKQFYSRSLLVYARRIISFSLNHWTFCVANLKICLILFIAVEQYSAGLFVKD